MPGERVFNVMALQECFLFFRFEMEMIYTLFISVRINTETEPLRALTGRGYYILHYLDIPTPTAALYLDTCRIYTLYNMVGPMEKNAQCG